VPHLGRPGELTRVVDGYRIVQVVFWNWPGGGLTELRALAALRARRIRLRWRVDAAALLATGARGESFGGRASAVLEPGPPRPLEAGTLRLLAVLVGLLLGLVTWPGWLLARLLPHGTTITRRLDAPAAGTLSAAVRRDGSPRSLICQAPLAWALLRGRLALSGPPLRSPAPGAAVEAPDEDPWLLERPLPGLTGRWAGATLGGRLRRIWRDPAGLSRFLRHDFPEERQ
jgi:hypothetical protein